MLNKIIIALAMLLILPAISLADQAAVDRIAQLPEAELLKLLKNRELVTVDHPDRSGRRQTAARLRREDAGFGGRGRAGGFR